MLHTDPWPAGSVLSWGDSGLKNKGRKLHFPSICLPISMRATFLTGRILVHKLRWFGLSFSLRLSWVSEAHAKLVNCWKAKPSPSWGSHPRAVQISWGLDQPESRGGGCLSEHTPYLMGCVVPTWPLQVSKSDHTCRV